MGGGTPSIYPLNSLHQILDLLLKRFNPAPHCEISLEINPGTLGEAKLNSYLQMGFNRFSLGVQTFKDEFLHKLGREHKAKESLKDLQLLSQKGLCFSTDLLFALPHQSLQDVQKDVVSILSYQPKHISTYCLTLPSTHFLNKGRAKDKEQEKMFFWLHDFLTQKNFSHYELSSFALPRFESKHNTLYWRDKNYIGFGLSAHSYLREHSSWGTRFANPKTMKAYLNYVNSIRIDSATTSSSASTSTDTTTDKKASSSSSCSFWPFWEKGVEVLKINEALTDFCHTSLRTQRGLWEEELNKKFPPHAIETTKKNLHSPLLSGLITKEQESFKGWKYRLSPRGRLLANQVFAQLTFLNSDFNSNFYSK